MLKRSLVLTILLSLCGFNSALAAQYQRNIDVEWEPIDGAASYEVEFVPEQKGEGQTQKSILHKVKEPLFTGKMVPGEYKMRVRARDPRGVPGDWSGYETFKVQLENAKLILPKSDDQIFTQQESTYPVDFQWAPLGGALSYRFELYSEDKVTQITQEVRDTSIRLNIPVAQKYTWKVTGLHKGLESEATSVDQFSLIGKKLNKPIPQKQPNNFVRDVTWSEPNFAAFYSFRLSRYDTRSKTWERVTGDANFMQNGFAFDANWPGGKYKISVKAKGHLRESSDLAEYIFPVKEGDRSPASELTTTVRKSIERTNGFYAIASYLVTSITYSGSSRDTNNSISYNAVGGTGRVGLGYLSSYTPWGFLGVVDYSGFLVGQTNYTYANAEVNGLYRQQLGERGESRHHFGVFYKEVPETVGNNVTGIANRNDIKAIGPHYGYEYWYAFSDKIGLQANIHLYPSLFKISTPGDKRMAPRISAQTGLLGSYRFNKKITGLIGYAFRSDSMAYYATENPDIQVSASDTNEVNIEGHYLNLFVEWAL